MLGRDDLIGKATLRTDVVKISLGEVKIRELTGAEREEYFQLVSGESAAIPPGMQARFIRWCCIDENLEPLFFESDEEKINQMGGSDMEKLVLAILRLSALTTDVTKTMEKNSTGDRNASPGSGSPRLSAAQ